MPSASSAAVRPFEASIAFQTDKAPAAYLALGELVDRYDFDAVSVYNDLFFQPALGPLLHLARVVTRARLGPADRDGDASLT